MKPVNTGFLRGIIYVSTCRMDKVMKKINFDSNLDPDPEWLLICAMCSNTKLSSYHALSNKISHVPFAGPQPDIFVCGGWGGAN